MYAYIRLEFISSLGKKDNELLESYENKMK